MSLARPRKSRGMLAAVAGAAFLLAACSDDPVGPNGDGDDHADAAGVLITWFGGDVLYIYMDGDEIEPLVLPANMAVADVGVTFLDEDGDPIAMDDDLAIDLVIGNEEVLSWELAGGPSGTPPHFRLDLQTGEAGNTTAQLLLVHEGHPDWESPDVPVIVEDPDAGNEGG